jgi:hypothetical protein
MHVNFIKNLQTFEEILEYHSIDTLTCSLWEIHYIITKKLGYVSIPERPWSMSSEMYVREIHFDISEQDLVWLSLKHGVEFKT